MGGRGGLKVGRVLGVPVYVQPSWFVFALFIVGVYGPQLADELGNGPGYLTAAAFALLLGLSVLLHEFGHCVVARLFDLPVRSITITLLAGLTEITEPPQTPAREYSVAISGPMVSLFLCAVGAAVTPLLPDDSVAQLLCLAVAYTNGAVAVFNLLPGLPLDGGRVLRSVVWHVVGDGDRATRAAARAGQVVALVLVPLLLVVAIPAALDYEADVTTVLFSALMSAFIYAGATAALRRSKVLSKLPSVSVVALARPSIRVPADLPLSEAVRRAQEAGARGVVVVDSADRLEAVVSEAAVLATPEARRPWVSVGTVARRIEEGMVLDPYLSGEPLLEALRRHPSTEYVVTDPATGEVRVVSVTDVAAAVTP
jgi:Zn-dependent protease